MNTVVQILDSIAEDAARADRSDDQLLDLFVRLRDDEAFASVVRRHGQMVLGVCRRVLRNPADADDAFQAAFLVLARKAATIGSRHRLAQWLHGVAFNTARKLRETNARRATRERPLSGAPEPHANAPDARDELLALLDEEVSRLPERYRAVVVLCDLEGRTRREAAKALACPEGTVAGRLARARDLLAARLTARGAVPAAGLLAAVLTKRTATALPPATLAGVVRAVSVDSLAGATATGLISQRVADTTEGVLKTMFTNKLRAVVPVVFCVGLALACGVGAIHMANAQPAPTPSDPRFLPGAAKPPEVKPAPAEAEKKSLCVIPLVKLDAKPTAEKLTKLLPVAVTVAAVRNENALLVYATAKGTDDVRLVLRTLGEDLPKEDVKPDAKKSRLKARMFTFSFKNQPWGEVLAWYSKESGLGYASSVKPTGTFTFEPPAGQQFTLAEFTDVLNEALAQQKYILIRRDKTFILHPADEKIDAAAVRRVELADLPEFGRTEIVEVQLPLTDLDADAARDELRKLLTPFGEIAFAKEKTLVIRDTAGSVERIAKTLSAINVPAQPPNAAVMKQIALTKLKAADVAPQLQKTFPRMQFIAIPAQNSLMVLGTPDEYARLADVLHDLETQFQNPAPGPKPKVLDIRLKDVPWKDVMTWYAETTGLTGNYTALPKGTFTCPPSKPGAGYTLTELTDLINDALIAEKWLLIRGERSFTMVPADEKVDPKFITHIELHDLDKRGRTEFVTVHITLPAALGPEMETTARKLLGPFGKAGWYLPANTLILSDTVENVKTIVITVRALEKAGSANKPGGK